jgi:hypothetical protein
MQTPPFAVDNSKLQRVLSPEFANTMYALAVEMRARGHSRAQLDLTVEMTIRSELGLAQADESAKSWIAEARSEILERQPDTGTAWNYFDLDKRPRRDREKS